MRDIVRERKKSICQELEKKRASNSWLLKVLSIWNQLIVGSLDYIYCSGLNYDLLVYLFYLVLVVVFTWPLLPNIGQAIPGLGNDGGDGFMFVWNVWWVKKQILAGLDIYFTDYIFAPRGANLVFHTLSLSQSLLTVFLSYFFNLIASFNIVYLFFMWLSAFFTYILAKELWRSRSGALVAGLIFAFCPYVFIHSLGHFNLTTIWPFPALVFFLIKMIRERKFFWAIAAGCVFGFVFLNDWQYFVFASILVVCVLIYNIIICWQGKTKWKLDSLYTWVVFFAVSLILISPLLIKSLDVSGEYLPKALISEVVYWSADLFSFVIPSFLHTLWGDLGLLYGEKYNLSGIENYLYVGLPVIVLFVVSLYISFRGKDNKDISMLWFWQIVAILFGVLSLGPLLKIGGNDHFFVNDIEYNVALPYLLLYKLPFFSVSRVPARFYIVLMLALAMVAACVVRVIVDRWNQQINIWSQSSKLIVVLFISLLVAVDYLSVPLSLQAMEIPPAYDLIKEDSDDFVILELPLWWSSGHRVEGDPKTIIQYYQTYHEKRILNGAVSRVPGAAIDYYFEIPGIKYLIDVDNQQIDEASADKYRVLSYWQDELGIRYVVLHAKYYDRENYYRIRSYLESILGLDIYYQDEEEVLYYLPDDQKL